MNPEQIEMLNADERLWYTRAVACRCAMCEPTVEALTRLAEERRSTRNFVSKVMNLGLDPSDNGSGWHNQRAEAAEKRVAELEKAQMALAALASISGEPSK